MLIERPGPTVRKKQPLGAEKGYDSPDIRELSAAWADTAPLKLRGQEEAGRKAVPGYRARQWVLEGTHGWFNREKPFECPIPTKRRGI